MNTEESTNNDHHHRKVIIPVLLVFILMLSSSAGCVDKTIIEDIVEKVEGEDESNYVWKELINVKGNFIVSANTNSDPDYVMIGTKVIENITNTNQNPQQTTTNLKMILNEENLSMEKRIVTFRIKEDTRNLNIELKGIFNTFLGEDGPSGGYMELTIINPDGGARVEEMTQFSNEDDYTYPQTPIAGEWTLELQGIGLQSFGAALYSGEYELRVRAEEPKE